MTKHAFSAPWLGALLAFGAMVSTTASVAADPQKTAATAPSTDSSATATVDRLHDALIASMKAGEEAGFDERVAILGPVVRDCLDFSIISRLVLGRQWAKLSDEDRSRFIDTFSRYVIADYAHEFKSFNGQRFENINEQERKPTVHIVRSILHNQSGKTHRFEYQIRQSQGQWWIVSIAVDGVSDLATKRSQYARVIQKDGLSTLIETLESRIDDFRKGRDVDD